jgi:hypothetical protein
MTTLYLDREAFTLYAGALPMLAILGAWLFCCVLFIRARDWQTKVVGWTLLIAPLLHYWKDGGL